MESVVAALVSVALILFAALTVSQGTLSTHSVLSESWKAMEARSGEITRTGIAVTGVSVLSGGTRVEATVANQGSTHMRSFGDWDVLLEYYDNSGKYHIQRLTYTVNSSLGSNQWTVKGIYTGAGGATPETFGPGTLDPGEEMTLAMRLSPNLGSGTTARFIVGTPNGVTASAIFSY